MHLTDEQIKEIGLIKYPEDKCWYGSPARELDANLSARTKFIEGFKAGYAIEQMQIHRNRSMNRMLSFLTSSLVDYRVSVAAKAAEMSIEDIAKTNYVYDAVYTIKDELVHAELKLTINSEHDYVVRRAVLEIDGEEHVILSDAATYYDRFMELIVKALLGVNVQVHDWRYNFPNMPTRRICAMTGKRSRLLGMADFVEDWTGTFEDKRTDAELIEAWFKL